MPQLNSSVLNAADYDPKTETLTVTFHSGARYKFEVPPEVAQNLMKAPSAGQYFMQNIRGVYPGTRLDEEG